MGPLLEYVAHCWRYERALTFALSAFVLNPPTACRARVTIFYAADDRPVVDTLEFFRGLRIQPLNVEWNFRALDPPQLCRRAIGRNMAALETPADFVLFSDVDYLFGKMALDTAAQAMPHVCSDGPKLMWPRYLLSSIDHASGDAELARVGQPQVIDVDPLRYEAAKLGRAIGGAQWFPGDFCRERGYLKDSKRFQRPVARWVRTFEDRAWRIACGLPLCELIVPNVFRLRHSTRGRTNVGCRN